MTRDRALAASIFFAILALLTAITLLGRAP